MSNYSRIPKGNHQLFGHTGIVRNLRPEEVPEKANPKRRAYLAGSKKKDEKLPSISSKAEEEVFTRGM
jgi:hypothetical protein